MADDKSTIPSPYLGFVLNSQGETLSIQQDVVREKDIVAPFSIAIEQHTVIIDLKYQVVDIMATAVNNRTRERNYFKLYSELLEQKITEEEFDRLIEENPDEYVQERYRDYGPLELDIARIASEKIMDVDDVSDMATLFSISNDSIQKCIVAANE